MRMTDLWTGAVHHAIVAFELQVGVEGPDELAGFLTPAEAHQGVMSAMALQHGDFFVVLGLLKTIHNISLDVLSLLPTTPSAELVLCLLKTRHDADLTHKAS